MCSSKPLSRSKTKPRAACGGANNFINSSRTRSALMILIFGASTRMAANVGGSIAKSNCAANRTARSIRR